MSLRPLYSASALLILAACGQDASQPAAKAAAPVAAAPALPPQALSINAAVFSPPPPVPPQPAGAATGQDWPPTAAQSATAPPELAGGDAATIKAEVLLARAHFSPGVIDGKPGDNLRRAISTYEAAHNLPVDGKLDAAVWQALNADTAPVISRYTISSDDVKGPFIPAVPDKMEDMAALPAMAFTSPRELLAEKFHMGEGLLQALNPGVDFTQAGVSIVVADLGPSDLPAAVTRVEVDRAHGQVRAFGADGQLLASYPATIGSTDRPSPSGTWKVKGVARNPPYEYDPARLTFGKIGHKLEVKPGPNNPVGAVWIDLSKDTYGIHGTPDPGKIGKAQSHGCVRLNNSDALQLAAAVKPGTVVAFLAGKGRARAG